MPFAALPLVAGFLAWNALGLALLFGALRLAGLGVATALAVVLSPAAFENALGGQNGALTAMALAGGLLLAPRRPLLAGALFGLLTIKPQLGLLLPVCLLAARSWAAIAWTAAFAALYVGASLLFLGADAWQRYLDVTAPFMQGIMEAPFGLAFQMQMPSPYISARAAGAGLGLAYAAQAAATVGCIIAVAWAWRNRPSAARPLATALTLLLVPLATPYAHSYDLVCSAVGVAILAERAFREGAGPAERMALTLAWLWPGVAFMFGVLVMPGLGPLVMLPAVLVAMRRIHATPVIGRPSHANRGRRLRHFGPSRPPDHAAGRG
jgi:hypothetical protein